LPLLALLALLVAAFLVSCAGGGSGSSGSSSPGSASLGENDSEANAPGGEAKELGPPVLGDASAPVVMVEYGDYQ
jgi:hypothetical protein